MHINVIHSPFSIHEAAENVLIPKNFIDCEKSSCGSKAGSDDETSYAVSRAGEGVKGLSRG